MAQIFSLDPTGSWSVTPVPTEPVQLAGIHPVDMRPLSEGVVNDSRHPEIHRGEYAGKAVWVLLIPAQFSIWVNGRRTGHIRVLRHRDSIWWPGADAAFFSTEKLAKVEIYPGHSERLDCPRCKKPILEGNQIVVCHGCSTIHHMEPDPPLRLNCWTYSDHCGACPYSSDMSGGLRWVPEVA